MLGKLGRCKKIKLDNLPTPQLRINLKWIKELNIRLEGITAKSLTFLLVIFLSDISLGQRTNKQMGLYLRSFCTAKETINEMEKHHTEWEMIFAKIHPIRG